MVRTQLFSTKHLLHPRRSTTRYNHGLYHIYCDSKHSLHHYSNRLWYSKYVFANQFLLISLIYAYMCQGEYMPAKANNCIREIQYQFMRWCLMNWLTHIASDNAVKYTVWLYQGRIKEERVCNSEISLTNRVGWPCTHCNPITRALKC